MTDRTPTQVLGNGAVRYGIYDSGGNLLRYEYIRPEDLPTQAGTPINKASLLKDATAALYGKDSTAVPDDILAAIKPLLDGKLKFETGSYVGTGTSGISNQNSLTFSFAPILVIVIGPGGSGSLNDGEDVGIFPTLNRSNSQSVVNTVFCTKIISQDYYAVRYYSSTDGKTIKWFVPDGTAANFQLNKASMTYKYCAIGY